MHILSLLCEVEVETYCSLLLFCLAAGMDFVSFFSPSTASGCCVTDKKNISLNAVFNTKCNILHGMHCVLILTCLADGQVLKFTSQTTKLPSLAFGQVFKSSPTCLTVCTINYKCHVMFRGFNSYTPASSHNLTSVRL